MTDHIAFSNYRDALRDELARRCERNARYSQAAFARDIGLSASLLSEVLAGKHDLSRVKAESIVSRLGWSGTERETFCDSAELASTRSVARKSIAKSRLIKRAKHAGPKRLLLDRFALIADWHHIAVLEFLNLVRAISRLLFYEKR